jgi:TrmH family RNA methyltransferase
LALLYLDAILCQRKIMSETNNWRGTVEMIRRAGTRKGRATGGYFSIEGIRLHERALRAGVRVQQAIVTTSFQKDSSARVQTLLADLQEQGCRLEIVPGDVIGEIIGGRDLGQILGLVRMPEQRQLADVTNSKDMNRPLLLVAVDVKDPGNVGALLRTAHASGATAFVATGISDPFHPKALRTTMGSLFKLPVLLYKDPMPLINQLRELGIETVGTAVSGGTLLTRATFSNVGVAVLIGSEAWGLPENVQTGVDRLVSIPMKAGVDSFSVNAAAAIVLYEIGRIRE